MLIYQLKLWFFDKLTLSQRAVSESLGWLSYRMVIVCVFAGVRAGMG